ncbi:TfoX/Sxy family protein [Candidatus Gracilibacteria bacterium]|nr:TfoX/Sxy family protein [Candidatus Gracilibacteria bacterium]
MPKPLPESLEYFLQDCLKGDTNYNVKPLFGGYGVYYKGQIFAIHAWDVLYMKVGDNNRQDYIDAGSKEFEYVKKDGKVFHMNYWELPDEVLEDKVKLVKWIGKSLEAHQKN